MTSDRDPIWRRYRDLLRRRPAADVDDEVRHHLAMREQEAIRSGLDAAAARAAARERFGDVDGVVAQLYAIDGSRERRRLRADWLRDLRQDVRFALRSLRRAPAFTATAVLTIAVAIAANTTIFSFVLSLLVEPLPYTRPSELFTIDANLVMSTGELLALRQRTTGLAAVAVTRQRSITFADDLGAVRLDGATVSANLFPLLGVAPEVGRAFTTDAERPGGGNVIVISHEWWMTRYGGDRRVVGRYVQVDGNQCLVMGVMPPSFSFPSTATRFWAPLTVNPANVSATWAVSGGRWIARLAPGVSRARSVSLLRGVLPAFRRLNPMWDPGDDYGMRVALDPLQQSLVGAERPALLLLAACVAVVLLVAWVNLANLMLSRVTARRREFAVRAALGGGRSRLVRQLLTECGIVAIAGASLGVLAAIGGVRWSVAALPASLARPVNVRVDGLVLALTAAITLATTIAVGLVPALRAASSGGTAGVVGAGRGGTGDSHRLASTLVAAEVAFAVLLAVTAGLLVRSFQRLTDRSPGFAADHVVSAKVSPPPASYAGGERTTAFYEALLARLRTTPGVASAGLVDRLPIAAPVYGMAVRVEGQFEDATHSLPTADHMQVATPGYFDALRIPILRGRAFTADDRAGAPPVVIVSQALARHFWPDGNAVGHRIGYPYESPWMTIVGVVPDVRLDSLRDTSAMAVYIPFRQRASRAAPEMTVVVRTTGPVEALERSLRDLVASIDRSVPVSAVLPMDDVVAHSVVKPRLTTLVVSIFAAVTLLLGAVGIYGVTSYVVGRRTREMGVRMALGATRGGIARLVIGRAVLVAGAGAVAGCVLAVAASRAIHSLLVDVSPTDPVAFASAAALLVVVAVAASLVPARRAMRVDPVEALRQD